MRTILFLGIAAAMLGCGGDDEASDPHAVTDCASGTWPAATSGGKCERGCAAGPSGAMDADMNGRDDTCGVAGPVMFCASDHVATFDGLRGCCSTVPTTAVTFVECEAK